MNNIGENSSPEAPKNPRKSRAAIRLEAIKAKQASLIEQYKAAEAAVSAEKHAAAIRQGLSDFVGLFKQKLQTKLKPSFPW